MDVLVHRVLLHLTVFSFERMVWVTMLIKLNMLPHELGLFLEPKGILLNPLARRKLVQMMADYTMRHLFFGPPEESFKLLPAYCHRLEEVNPGTITALKTNVANQFEYMFIAHAASLHGFLTVIRPVIAIDGTHLKGKFFGIMFVAICLDGNNQVFPLAYGFGDVENEISWTWFFNELKNAIGSPKDCMIISDLHLGIKVAMEKVYPNIPHGYCVFHIAQNIKKDYKRKDVRLLFKQAWKAYQKFEFKETMLEMMKVNKVAFKELMNVGPERWFRAYSPVRRYRLMTFSITKSMNSCLVHARQMTITTMIEFIRDMLQKWFYKRRTKAEKTRTQLTPWATELIKERNIDSEKYTVCPIDSVNFNVKDGKKDGMRRNLYPIILGIAKKPQVGLKHMQGPFSLLGILVIGIFLKMCNQRLFFHLLFMRKLEDQERRDLCMLENMVMERPEIVLFVKNRVTTDKIAGMHSLVRLLHHAHPYHLQHPQHRSDHVDLTDT
ncbi:hypothetical protein Ddye_008108 [Dipteronia dyeriana]|uniref:MULE transposase domain-containing protein n=1 Tax=Dipteronia dyeriana TaxID=168575 RepID=A0AAD9X9A6_9ROSI|nr:hypothetical protein Ddye_008108 [Dipteronia dyeriana]